MAKAVLLDSGFLIRLMNPEEPLHQVAFSIFKDYITSGVTCKASTIALAEYGVKGNLQFLPTRYLQYVPFLYNHAEVAAQFIPDWSLETNDRNDHNLGHKCGLMG